MTNIMVATDGSDGARRAIDVAAKLAKALACNLLIVTVADRLLEEEARRLPHSGATAGDLLEALTGQTLKAAEAQQRRSIMATDQDRKWRRLPTSNTKPRQITRKAIDCSSEVLKASR